MLFDYDDGVNLSVGFMPFPDFPFAAQPLDDVGETVILRASNTGTAQSVGGTADHPE